MVTRTEGRVVAWRSEGRGEVKPYHAGSLERTWQLLEEGVRNESAVSSPGHAEADGVTNRRGSQERKWHEWEDDEFCGKDLIDSSTWLKWGQGTPRTTLFLTMSEGQWRASALDHENANQLSEKNPGSGQENHRFLWITEWFVTDFLQNSPLSAAHSRCHINTTEASEEQKKKVGT